VSEPNVSGNGSKSKPATTAHVLRYRLPATVDGSIKPAQAGRKQKAGDLQIGNHRVFVGELALLTRVLS
jgi:hypothetical protein